jgi:phospholipid/cholesterol/gamma-HCH transport system permease protein
MTLSSHNSVEFRTEGPQNGLFKVVFAGHLDSTTTAGIWRQATAAIGGAKAANVIVDAGGVDYCDGAGIAQFFQLRKVQTESGGNLEISGLRSEFAELMNGWEAGRGGAATPEHSRKTPLTEEIGQATVEVWRDIHALIAFVGELCAALVHAAFHPRSVRWRDALAVAEAAGVNALPIVALVSFLMGLIMAFQAAIPLRQFGAELFVANLIGLSMLRELGPLMTAIILAGRSGSAFAAELGTMRVREEIDALKTMGLDPVRFLVVPRVVAAVFMMPLLTIFANLLGLMGGSVVML